MKNAEGLLTEEAKRRKSGADPPGVSHEAELHTARGEGKKAALRKRDGPADKAKRRGKAAKERARARAETSDMWWRFAVKLLLTGLILAAAFRFVLGVQIQRGNRMYPFIMDGDLVVTYKLEEYKEGDAVAYRRPDTGQIAISRIAARGPCQIQIDGSGGMTADGAPRGESAFYTTAPLAEYGISYPYPLSASGYFLLDDNREIGSDSRAFGEVRRWELLGKVVYVFRRRGI